MFAVSVRTFSNYNVHWPPPLSIFYSISFCPVNFNEGRGDISRLLQHQTLISLQIYLKLKKKPCETKHILCKCLRFHIFKHWEIALIMLVYAGKLICACVCMFVYERVKDRKTENCVAIDWDI